MSGLGHDDVVVLTFVLHQGIAVFVGKVKDRQEAEGWADVALAFNHLFIDVDEGVLVLGVGLDELFEGLFCIMDRDVPSVSHHFSLAV